MVGHWKPSGTVWSTGSVMGEATPGRCTGTGPTAGGGASGSARVTPGRDGGGLRGERRRRPVERVTYPSRSPGLGLAVTPVARCEVVGVDETVPVLDGRTVPYVNLDNAASTPALRAVARGRRALPALLRQRPPRHRLQVARQHGGLRAGPRLVGGFVGADPDRDVVVFAQEHDRGDQHSWRARPCRSPTTRSCSPRCSSTTPTTCPWRARAAVVHVRARPTARSTSTISTGCCPPTPAASRCSPSPARRT